MPRIYETMKFPKYKFEEFPKFVTGPDGKRYKVHDAHEELRIAQLPASPGKENSAAENERQELIEKAHKANADAADANNKLGEALDQLAIMKKKIEDLESKPGTGPAPSPPPKPPAKAA